MKKIKMRDKNIEKILKILLSSDNNAIKNNNDKKCQKIKKLKNI